VFEDGGKGVALDLFHSCKRVLPSSIPLMTAMPGVIPGKVDQCWWIGQY
jgi:hypothetical protein